MLPPKPSAWNVYPTSENPFSMFKYASIEINLSQDVTTVNRQTYSTLDFIGDIGGLIDGLRYVLLMMITPFSKYQI